MAELTMLFPSPKLDDLWAHPDLAGRIGEWCAGFIATAGRLARIEASIEDFVGCVIAGTRRSELRPALWLAHGGGVPVWGLQDSFDPAGAALVTGTAGSLLQLHDFYASGGSHPCSPVIAAAWSAQNSLRADHAPSFVAAVAAGYEVANRVADACMPGQIVAGGTPTATAGAIGGAVAAALIAGLDSAGVARAVSNSAMLVSLSPLAAMRAHGALVPLHCGLAARAGYEAASLAHDAHAGIRLLEGDAACPGLIALLGGNHEFIVPESWQGETIDSVGWKFFPACFGSHVALEAVLRLGPIDPQTIQHVTVKQSSRLLDTIIESGPHDGCLYDRLMSIRWVLARALEVNAYRYPGAVAENPQTIELARKIDIGHDRFHDALLPDTLCATIDVHTTAGTRRIQYRRPSRGDPSGPGPRGWTIALDKTALRRKFEALTEDTPTMSILAAMGIRA